MSSGFARITALLAARSAMAHTVMSSTRTVESISTPDETKMESERLRVLVVDDEPNIRSTLSVCLESAECEVHAAAGPREALAAVERRPFDLVFLDLRLGQTKGTVVLRDMLHVSPRLAVVVITAYASIESAVEAMKAGAQDYLPKPFTPTQIRIVVDRFRERRALENRVFDLEGRLSDSAPTLVVETRSQAMQQAIDTVTQAAKADTPVLLRGESGTGKGVLARLLHERSARAAHRLVTVNCPTLTPSSSRASSSGTCAVRSRAQCATSAARWKKRTAAPCSWTRSERSLPRFRPNCFDSRRITSSSAWVMPKPGVPMYASSRQRTETSRPT